MGNIEAARAMWREKYQWWSQRTEPDGTDVFLKLINDLGAVLEAYHGEQETEKEPEQPLVRNPDGGTWIIKHGRKPYLYIDNGVQPPNMISDYRPMTREQAFKVGAIVKFEVKETSSIIEASISDIYEGMNYVRVLAGPGAAINPHIDDLTLVTPAPEEKINRLAAKFPPKESQ